MSNQSDFGGTESNDSGTHDEVETLAAGAAGATPSTKKPASTPWYLSRTLWINVAALLSMLVPSVRDWLAANPIQFTGALGAINVLLRFITLGKYQLAEPPGDQDGGADESAPRASNTSGTGGSAIKTRVMLTIGALMLLLGGSCSTAPDPVATSVALSDGQVVVIRGTSSLVVDRSNHSLSWAQSTPDVVVVPPVVQATSK